MDLQLLTKTQLINELKKKAEELEKLKKNLAVQDLSSDSYSKDLLQDVINNLGNPIFVKDEA